MSEPTTDLPVIQLARAQYDGSNMVLLLETRDRTAVEFILDPMAVALLALTLQPEMRLQLADIKAANPGVGERPPFPDSPEGL